MKPHLSLLAIVVFVLGAFGSAVAADRIGKIKITSGEVTIERDGQALTAKGGDEIFERDVVRTGENSAVGMTFSDNSRVSLGPDSVLELENYALGKPGKPDGFDLRIRKGSLSAASGEIAKTRPLAMRVLMPTTVLGVKGTQFAVRVAEAK